MAIRDLIPWNRGRDITVRRDAEPHPFLALHREVNRLFDDVFRGFDLAPFGMADRLFDRANWPKLELSETDKELRISAELPGLDEKDIDVTLANGVLVIRGEKRTETEDRDRRFSERFYGRFERRIPVEEIDEDKVTASFKKGILTVTLPKSATAQQRIRRISIDNK